VRDEDGRQSQSLLEVEQGLLQAVARDRVERTERLVEQHDPGRGRERARHAHALLLAAGQFRRPALADVARQLHQLEDLIHPLSDPCGRPALERERHGHVLGHGPVREEPHPLEDVPDAAPQRVRLDRSRVLSAEADAAGGRLDQPVDHLQQRGLARPGPANQCEQLTLLHLQRHRVDHGGRAVAPGEAIDVDHRRRGSCPGVRFHRSARARRSARHQPN
jgi:hypothetical protein